MLTGAVALLAAALALTWYAVDRSQRGGYQGMHARFGSFFDDDDENVPRPAPDRTWDGTRHGPARAQAAGKPGSDPSTGYEPDDTLTGTDIIDYSAPLRGEAPVMAGHYDVPRPASAAAPERRELSGPGYPSAWDAPFPHGARLPDSGAPDTQVIATTRIGDIFLPLTGTEPDGPWPPLAGERVSGSLSDDTDIHNFRIPPGRAARNIWQPPARESAWDRYARCGVPDSLRYVQWILAAPLPQVKALTA